MDPRITEYSTPAADTAKRISRFGNRFSHKNAGKNLDDNEEMTIFGITIEQFICCKLFIVRKSQLLPQWRINRQDRNARS